jgi:hypothetical protein
MGGPFQPGLPGHAITQFIQKLQTFGFVLRRPHWLAHQMGIGAQSQPHATRGRKSLPAVEYAQLARDYVAAKKNGRPIVELAKARRRPHETEQRAKARIRSAIARARTLGYLTTGGQGQIDGILTPKSDAVLKTAARRAALERMSD